MKILILGGTQEARRLSDDPQLRRDHSVIFSLAGVTQAPLLPNTKIRTGGFGCVAGLIKFLQTENIDRVIDATHPFAEQMSRHAVFAARMTRTPLLRLVRAPWRSAQGDDWTCVKSIDDVVAALGSAARNVLLTTGRQHLAPFIDARSWQFHLRVIEAVATPLPPHIRAFSARPPFSLESEMALLQHLQIDTIVSKNSGAPAVQAKLQAARLLNRSVVMIDRPRLPPATEVESISQVLAWLTDLSVA